MRHNKKFNHLGRTSSHRKAMLSNMCVSLIQHKRIFTTLAKAKALRKVVEPVINRSKDDTTHSRRLAFQVLQSKSAVTELFQDIAKKVADRPGGYTRIIKTGNRLGDNAEMCFIELVDYNENMLKEKKTEAKTRTRRSAKSKTSEVKSEGSAEMDSSLEVASSEVGDMAVTAKPAVKNATTATKKPAAKKTSAKDKSAE